MLQRGRRGARLTADKVRWMGVNVHTVSLILGFGVIVRVHVVSLSKCARIIVSGL